LALLKGGGHIRAAGATIKEFDFKKVKEMLKNDIKAIL
jgi:phosphoesterase RecJ-like protein